MEEEAGAVAEAEHARSSDELQHHSHFFAVVVDVVVLVDVVVVVVVSKIGSSLLQCRRFIRNLLPNDFVHFYFLEKTVLFLVSNQDRRRRLLRR